MKERYLKEEREKVKLQYQGYKARYNVEEVRRAFEVLKDQQEYIYEGSERRDAAVIVYSAYAENTHDCFCGVYGGLPRSFEEEIEEWIIRCLSWETSYEVYLWCMMMLTDKIKYLKRYEPIKEISTESVL